MEREKTREPEKEHEREREKEKEREKDGEKQKGLKCPECDSNELLQEDRAEIICNNCGLVIEQQQIDRGPDWRAFNQKDKEKKSRVGPPKTKRMHDEGLSTTIDWKNKDAYGRSLSNRKKQQMKRLRKWQKRISTSGSKERNLQFALGEIDRMASSLDVPESTREVASVIYRKALDKELLPGRSIEAVSATSLRVACRQDNIPRTLEEIAKASRVDQREVARTYRYISRELNLKIRPTDPSSFIPKFASKLNLSEEVQQKAKEIIEKSANEGLLSGKSPTGYAAAAIYLSSILCNESRTQKEIAEVADVTSVTIRNRYQEQAEVMGLN